MTFSSYFFILTLASTIHLIKSSFISSSVDGPIRNKSSILLPNQTLTSNLRRSLGTRIFGGFGAKDHKEYPFMVYLLRVTIDRNATYKHTTKESCGATLLSQTHALTAAHCLRTCPCKSVDDSKCSKCLFHGVDEFTLYFGSTMPNNAVVTSKLKNFYIHPEHKYTDTTNKCVHRFDIAVLELDTPLQFSDKISNIKLPEPVTLGKDELKSTTTSRFFDNNMKCTILGWGLTKIGDNTQFKQEKLKVAKVPLIGLEMCRNEIQFTRHLAKRIDLCTDTTFCSKSLYDINGICHGDSGGPIICNGVQVGVSSWSFKGCVGLHIPNMYTRVDINVQWIRDIMSGINITGRYMKIK